MDRITSLLLAWGWELMDFSGYRFCKSNGASVIYLYPEKNLLKYWEDIRAGGVYEEIHFSISEEKLKETLKYA